MRQAITTKYLGPTNSRGSQVKAIARKRDSIGPEMSHTEPFHRGTEVEHCTVAKGCAEKLGWSGLWVGGRNVDADGYVFVNVPCFGHPGTGWQGGNEGSDWFYVDVTAERKEAVKELWQHIRGGGND